MPDPVEKVRVAEGDVLRPRGHLSPDVFQHHLSLDDPELPAVHGDDRAVTAQVLATPAGLGIAHGPLPAIQDQGGIPCEGNQVPPVRDQEFLSGQRDHRLGLAITVPPVGQPRQQAHQTGLELAAQDRLGSQGTKVAFVHRGVQAVEAEVGVGVQGLDAGGESRSQPRGGVHWDVESDEVGSADRLFIQALHGQVQAGDRGPGTAEPGRRGGEPERLAAHFIGGDEDDASRHRRSLMADGLWRRPNPDHSRSDA
jgi:hypothetical protein